MHTVPSLIGTGTAVAAAASGLVFGEAIEQPSSTSNFAISSPTTSTFRPPTAFRSSSHSATESQNHEPRSDLRFNTLSPSRPRTSSTSPWLGVQGSHHHTLTNPPVVSRPPLSRYQRPKTSLQSLTSPKPASKRQSASRNAESAFSTIAATPRDSISSNGSWYRRFSLRPLSQHESERSSIGPDSTSIAAFSNGSAAPILSQSHAFHPPSTPNKLVKRTPSTSDEDPAILPRRRSNSQFLTLRRPATSHQRSATQQFQAQQLEHQTPAASVKNSLETNLYLQAALLPSPFEKEQEPKQKSGWKSFFHSRTSTIGRSVGRKMDSNPENRNNTPRRILLSGSEHKRRAHLIKPRMVSSTSQAEGLCPTDIQEEPDHVLEPVENPGTSVENTPLRNARRSISLTLSASNLVSRASGSLRRPKRGATPMKENVSPRHVSDPITGSPVVADRLANANEEPPSAPNPYLYSAKQGPAPATATNSSALMTRNRNSSSPLPPLSRLSSFHVELSRSGSVGGAPTQHPLRHNQPSGSSTSSTAISQLRAQQNERASTMEGSESELRDFMSGDDEDTDFKSDTMFDSIRTGTSGRVRTVDTPLDSMYDESPPSSTGNGKAKRLSIQEILGKDWDLESRIMEEDESISTPTRAPNRGAVTTSDQDLLREPHFSIDSAGKDMNRLSIEDDFDEDWAMDDTPYHALSPPSKSGSVNSRGMNPNLRLALANISDNSALEVNTWDNRSERPLSSIFDWSEASAHEKQDASRSPARPRTAYAKEERIARNGRSAVRRGPTPTHVRSQSVPVVHENPEPVNPKFGTWGMGSKPISEDWDDDFEFGASIGNDNKINEPCLFAVPESIQAAQPSVKAHSGQIRELSLLVNDLRRLCRHGRDMELMDGSQRTLWKEAEGIIALASPDDDSMEADHDCFSSIDLDAFETTDRYFDDGFESSSLDRLDAALDGREPVMSKTAVVRDRPSPRRRSVFSPDDDIFGGNWPLKDEALHHNRSSRPMTPESRIMKPHDVNGVVRTVVEAMQQRPVTEFLPDVTNSTKRMHFDTNSLKILVKRAGDLRDILSDIVRRVDQITQSPARTPRHQRQLESSPAFTKVFDDPGSSPPRRMTKSRSNTIVDEASPHNSPSSGVGRRLQMMMVN